MFKRFIKILAVALVAIILATSLASCKQSDVPDGYQLIACNGDKFRLYVPTQGWMPNVTGGVTSAFFSQSENTSVSVYVADDAGEMTVEEYFDYCNEKYENELDSYSFSGKSEKCVLGGQAARKYVFTAKNFFLNSESVWEKVTYKYMQVMARYEGEMYVFVYSAPEEYYDSHIEEVEGNSDGAGIIPYFVFADAYVSEDEKKYSDKVKVPAGMKLISTDERAYRFFVPQEWKVNDRTDMSAAYYSESDKSNVSVQLYICGTGDPVHSVETYFDRCMSSYGELFATCELVSESDVEMSGIDAKKYIMDVTSGGVEYKLLQAIVQKGDAIYCMTYTATADNFDAHIADVEKMIEVFEIR